MKKLCLCLLMYGAIISLKLVADQAPIVKQPKDQTDVYGIPTDMSEFEENREVNRMQQKPQTEKEPK